jgi:pimeloyl-ACP methyl ester carboxylesterase
MIGRNFAAHQDRQNHEAPAAAAHEQANVGAARRLKMPLLMMFGREDRAHAGERAELLKKQQPQINLHIMNGCKHMVHWDAFDDLMRWACRFEELQIVRGLLLRCSQRNPRATGRRRIS